MNGNEISALLNVAYYPNTENELQDYLKQMDLSNEDETVHALIMAVDLLAQYSANLRIRIDELERKVRNLS